MGLEMEMADWLPLIRRLYSDQNQHCGWFWSDWFWWLVLLLFTWYEFILDHWKKVTAAAVHLVTKS